jgi:hypothetical protein
MFVRFSDEIDSSLVELQNAHETIGHRLEEEYRKEAENKSPSLILNSYEDCKSVLTFLKLKYER